MSDVVSFAEIGGQHVELLPDRALLTAVDGVVGGVVGESVLGDPTDNGLPATDTVLPGTNAQPLLTSG